MVSLSGFQPYIVYPIVLYHPDFWSELDDLAGLGGDSWIVGGNFNVTRRSWEKSHGHTVTTPR